MHRRRFLALLGLGGAAAAPALATDRSRFKPGGTQCRCLHVHTSSIDEKRVAWLKRECDVRGCPCKGFEPIDLEVR